VDDLTASLRPYLQRHVLLGLSGGADSVAMLRALRLVGARVTAAHFDHQLRARSHEDAAWVARLCGDLGVPFVSGRAPIASIAASKRANVEATARELRYAYLSRAAREHGADVIVTAHTLDDVAETVLHQLLRGEHALTGIAARSGRVERPWLRVTRTQVVRFLKSLEQEWLEDDTNADVTFTRNWLRHEIMPRLRERFPAVSAQLARHGALAGDDEALLQEITSGIPAHADMTREPLALLRRFVVRELRAARLRYHADHVERLARALRKGETTHVTLPGGRLLTVSGGRMHLGAATWATPDFPVPPDWTLRHRLPGDRVRLTGGTRNVSDVLADRGVPRPERDRVWLLANGRDVYWIGLDPPVWDARHGVTRTPWWDEMGEALREAAHAARDGDVPVGAVVVRGGRVVARARNTSRRRGDMTRHAELAALREAADRLGTPYLHDCTLVVTLEPCPMCYGAAVEARVGGIVYAAPNPKLGALGGVTDLSRAHWGHRPTITPGVRAREASALLRAFFRERRASPDAPTE